MSHRSRAFGGYGVFFSPRGILERNNWCPHYPREPSDQCKEISNAVDIEGEKGEFCQGWYANGNRWYESTWLNGKKHGRYTLWDGEGRRVEQQNWRDHYLQGVSTRWYEDGQVAEEANYERFLFHGTYRAWFRNGQISVQAGFKKGLRDGQFVVWHQNGNKHCEANFKGDRLDGDWQEWDQNGNLIKKATYRAGESMLGSAKTRKPYAYPGVLGAPDFSFVLAQGSAWSQEFDTLRISASGRCDYRYHFYTSRVATPGTTPDAEPWQIQQMRNGGIYNASVWRKVEFWLTDEEQRALRDALQVADVFARAENYGDWYVGPANIRWVIRLRVSGMEKQIICDNGVPDCLCELSQTLYTRIMFLHRMEVMTATRLDASLRPKPLDDDAWLEDK
jgi:hypothetical protein